MKPYRWLVVLLPAACALTSFCHLVIIVACQHTVTTTHQWMEALSKGYDPKLLELINSFQTGPAATIDDADMDEAGQQQQD